MGLVDDLLKESTGASTKRSEVAKWLDGLAPAERDEWIEALRHPDITGAAIFRAMRDAGYPRSAATVTDFRRLHLDDYTPA